MYTQHIIFKLEYGVFNSEQKVAKLRRGAKPGAVDQPAIGSEGHDDECRRGHGHKMGQRQYGAQDTCSLERV